MPAPRRDPRYDALPEGIKAMVSPEAYLWLSDAEKDRLVQDMTQPAADAEDPAL